MKKKQGRPVGQVLFKVKQTGKPTTESGRLLAESILHEDELIEILGINKRILDSFRWARSFPHVNIIKGSRVYIRDSILKWLEKNETKLKPVVSYKEEGEK